MNRTLWEWAVRGALLALVAAAWILGSGGWAGAALLLLLSAAAVARLRFGDRLLFPILESAAVFALAIPFPDLGFSAWIAASVPVLGFAARSPALAALAPAAAALVLSPESLRPMVLAAVAAAFLLGRLLAEWRRSEDRLQAGADREREQRLELERVRTELLASSSRAARLAEVAERNRIAREVHDHTGHDLIGVLLSLQAARKLLDRGDPQAGPRLDDAVERLQQASERLRETVHNLRPAGQVRQEELERIARDHSHPGCPVDLRITGDLDGIPSGHLALLESSLKEALTNCARHSGASQVRVRLDRTPALVRMLVRDNGRGCQTIRPGLGLSGMGDQARRLGGQLTLSGEDGFLLVLVLPLDGSKEERP